MYEDNYIVFVFIIILSIILEITAKYILYIKTVFMQKYNWLKRDTLLVMIL